MPFFCSHREYPYKYRPDETFGRYDHDIVSALNSP